MFNHAISYIMYLPKLPQSRFSNLLTLRVVIVAQPSNRSWFGEAITHGKYAANGRTSA